MPHLEQHEDVGLWRHNPLSQIPYPSSSTLSLSLSLCVFDFSGAREMGLAALPPYTIIHPMQVKGSFTIRPPTSLRAQSICAGRVFKIEEWST